MTLARPLALALAASLLIATGASAAGTFSQSGRAGPDTPFEIKFAVGDDTTWTTVANWAGHAHGTLTVGRNPTSIFDTRTVECVVTGPAPLECTNYTEIQTGTGFYASVTTAIERRVTITIPIRLYQGLP